MFKIIDNSIPFHFQESLKAIVLSPDFPWSYTEIFASDGRSDITKRTKFISNGINFDRGYGFNHHLYFFQNGVEGEKSPFFDKFFPVVYSWMNEVDIVQIIKMNLRLTTKISSNAVFDEPHTDFTDKGIKTVVYYLFDTDGDTLFFNRKFQNGDLDRREIHLDVSQSVTPKQGRAIFFDSDTYHAGAHPGITNNRITLNVQYLDSTFRTR